MGCHPLGIETEVSAKAHTGIRHKTATTRGNLFTFFSLATIVGSLIVIVI